MISKKLKTCYNKGHTDDDIGIWLVTCAKNKIHGLVRCCYDSNIAYLWYYSNGDIYSANIYARTYKELEQKLKAKNII